jgi:hypothetical protein
MTNAHAAALASAQDSFRMLREALADLPDAAMDFTPAENTNSVAVLTMHSIAATRFMFNNGTGSPGSMSAYRSGERAAAFQAKGMTTTQVLSAIDSFLAKMESVLAKGTAAHLDEDVTFTDDPSANRKGVGFLIHGCAHLREHVGQAQLTRDLWQAKK